jgi:hypothetical protein
MVLDVVALHTTTTASYRRRQPEKTALYQVLQRSWLTFVERCEQTGRTLPKFIHDEVEAFTRCGILAYGGPHPGPWQAQGPMRNDFPALRSPVAQTEDRG